MIYLSTGFASIRRRSRAGGEALGRVPTGINPGVPADSLFLLFPLCSFFLFFQHILPLDIPAFSIMAITRDTQMRNARVLRSRRVAVTPVDRRSRPRRRNHDRLSTMSRRSESKQKCHPEHSDGLKEIRVGTSPELVEVSNLLHEQLTSSVEGAGSSLFFCEPLDCH